MTAMITVVGNLGGDPETRYTSNGRLNVNFSVASSRRWTDQNGQQQERTNWFRVTVWGNQAEGLVKLMDQGWLAKGQKVVVIGRFESREYQGNDGTTRTSLDITASEVVLAGSRQENQGGSYGGGGNQYSGGTQGTPSSSRQPSGGQPRGNTYDDLPDSGGDIDDIPF